MITAELQPRLYQYIGGIAKKNKIKLISIGGVEDHIHLLLSLAKTIDIAKAIQLIKGGSSKWVHDSFPDHRFFEWQEGYGAFSISIGDKARTIRYIDSQRQHHRKNDFKTEFIMFLDRHEIEYDLKHVFD